MLVAVVVTSARQRSKLLTAHLFYETGKMRHISFGDPKSEQYPLHKDDARRRDYIRRHQKRENWTASGITTAGFWSRWLLWNKKTLEESAQWLADKIGVPVIV